MRNWLLGIAGTVFLAGALYAGDSRWVVKDEFSSYLHAQREQSIKSEIRSLETQIIEIDAKLEYDGVSEERRASLEAKKDFLVLEKESLERDL